MANTIVTVEIEGPPELTAGELKRMVTKAVARIATKTVHVGTVEVYRLPPNVEVSINTKPRRIKTVKGKEDGNT